MLVLTRKPGEKLVIGDGIVVTVLEVSGNKIRIGIEAPADVRILRSELTDLIGPNAPTAEPRRTSVKPQGVEPDLVVL